MTGPVYVQQNGQAVIYFHEDKWFFKSEAIYILSGNGDSKMWTRKTKEVYFSTNLNTGTSLCPPSTGWASESLEISLEPVDGNVPGRFTLLLRLTRKN